MKSFFAIVFIIIMLNPFIIFAQNVPLNEQANTWAWFESNAFGDRKKAIPWYDKDSYPWTLAVRSDSTSDWERLWKGKEEKETRQKNYDFSGRVIEITTFLVNKRLSEEFLDPINGIIKEEREFKDGLPWRKRTYLWSQEKLIKEVVLDDKDQFLYTDYFFYLPNGQLRRIERNDAQDKPIAQAAWVYGQQGNVEQTDNLDGQVFISIKNEDSTLEEIWDHSTLLISRLQQADQKTRNQELSWAPEDKIKTLKTYDSKGHLIEEKPEKDSAEGTVRHWTYDDLGRVVRFEENTAEKAMTMEYLYDKNKDYSIKTFRNEELILQEYWQKGDKVKVQGFDQGDMVWEELWSKGRRSKVVFWKWGQKIREIDTP